MQGKNTAIRVGAALLAAVMVLAACGDASDEELPTAPDTVLDQPDPAGACLPDEPDCDDMVVVGGVLAGGGLSVSEALTTTAPGVLAVRGFLVDDGGEARLCELLAESLPPQCGGASVPVDGYDAVSIGPLSVAQGVTWSDSTVVIFGTLQDGRLVADPNVTG